MCCLVGGAALIGPRFALLVWWIFGNKVEIAISSWIWIVLGVLFLPWTTLAYVIAWQPGGIDGGWDILLILLGIALDIATYMARSAKQRIQPRY